MKHSPGPIDGKAFRKVSGGQSLGNSQGWGGTHVVPTHLVCNWNAKVFIFCFFNLLFHEFIMMSHCNSVCSDARYCWWENNLVLHCLVPWVWLPQPFALPFSKTASSVCLCVIYWASFLGPNSTFEWCLWDPTESLPCWSQPVTRNRDCFWSFPISPRVLWPPPIALSFLRFGQHLSFPLLRTANSVWVTSCQFPNSRGGPVS